MHQIVLGNRVCSVTVFLCLLCAALLFSDGKWYFPKLLSQSGIFSEVVVLEVEQISWSTVQIRNTPQVMDKPEIALISIPKDTGAEGRNREGNSQNPQKKQSYMKAGRKYLKEILNPEGPRPHTWNSIFLAACVLAVGTDPLFLYVPIIHEDKKCLGTDKGLKIAALVLRSFLDIFYITDIYYQIKSKITMPNSSRVAKITESLWPYFISIDILGVLPLPQVVILVLFYKVRGSRSMDIRKFLNFIVLCQYVLRIFRTYLSVKELKRTPKAPDLWVKGVLNFFLYVTASHVLGAFWYFLSIQRLTACWHIACRDHGSGCASTSFECNDINTSANRTFLNDFCPINPPNATVFDFGIFLDALQLGLLGPMNFPKKFMQCYWWGLRNLSSFGQNLKTSTFEWETWFAILVSVIGLLLFLYLIGNLQTYLQLAAINSEDEKQNIKINEKQIELIFGDKLEKNTKIMLLQHFQHANEYNKDVDLENIFTSFPKQTEDLKKKKLEWTCRKLAVTGSKKHEMQMKELSASLQMKESASKWMKENLIPENMEPILLQHVRVRLEDNKDTDVKNLLSILPQEHGTILKEHLCLPMFKKVPMLQEEEEFQQCINYLKPVVYNENSYIIREGEPLDLMLFITQGIVWTFPTSRGVGTSGSNTANCLQKGDFFGEELLNWTLRSTSLNDIPISITNLKCHTKVEAFALTANDLKNSVSNFWWKFIKQLHHSTESELKRLEPLALSAVKEARRRSQSKKPEDSPR